MYHLNDGDFNNLWPTGVFMNYLPQLLETIDIRFETLPSEGLGTTEHIARFIGQIPARFDDRKVTLVWREHERECEFNYKTFADLLEVSKPDLIFKEI